MNNLLGVTFQGFEIFGLEIRWYAVCILVGVCLAVYFAIKEARKIGIASDHIYTGVMIILPLSILGTRLWWVLFNLDKIDSFMDVFAIWDGGLAIQGGFITAFISVVLYCKKRGISFYKIIDLVAPGFLIGQICGRWGNFFNHELYGPAIENVDLFLKLCPGFIAENMKISGIYRHPTFLYESALNFVGLVLMLIARRKLTKLQSGDLVGGYLVWYGGVRIFTETLRSKSGANEILTINIPGLPAIPVSLMISVIFIVCGIAYLIVKRFIGPKTYYLEELKRVEENRYDTILFDLDGTLLDTRNLVNRSFIHTFEHFRPNYILSDEELDSFFGPSLRQTFSRYSDDEKEIEEMIKYYREYNISNHDEMVKVFPNAKEVLKKLNKKGYKIGVVSSKRTDMVEHGLFVTQLLGYMNVVIGEGDVSNPKPDPEGIVVAMKQLNSKKAMYVGDGLGDIAAGKNAGIDTIGVLYSNRADAIIAAEPTYTIANLNELLIILAE